MRNISLILIALLTLTSGFFSTSEFVKSHPERYPSTAFENHVSSILKIGVLLGTFDPPHLGHKNLALEMKNKFKLDIVYFIPRDKADYKPNKQSIATRNRLVELMLEDTPALKLVPADVAEKLKGLRSEEAFQTLRDSFPNNQISLILGDDSLNALNINHVKIPPNFQLLVTRRIGNEDIQIPSHLDGTPVNILRVQGESSSTDVRKILQTGGTPEMLPENVFEYINLHELYGTSYFPECMRIVREIAFP